MMWGTLRSWGVSTVGLLMTLLLLFSGCVTPSGNKVAGKNGLAQGQPEPVVIHRLETAEINRGMTVSVWFNRQPRYQVLKLNSPRRLLLVFEKTQFGPAVQPRVMKSPLINGIFPAGTEDGSGRLEIGLRTDCEYDINEVSGSLVLTLFSQPSLAASEITEIRDLAVSTGDRVTVIRGIGSGVAPEPKAFRLPDPPRLIIDWIGLKGGTNKKVVIDSPEARDATLASSADKTRVAVNLKSVDVDFQISQDKGMPVITLSERKLVQASGDRPAVRAVEFNQEQKISRVRIATSYRSTGVETQRKDNVLILRLKNTDVPKKWVRRMDVTAFGGPVSAIDTYREGSQAVVAINLANNGDTHAIVETPEEIQVRVTPSGGGGTEKAGEKIAFEGKKVSLDFKDINIQNVLRLLAETNNLNIILSDAVTGTVTMRLVDVPWDQALSLILEAKGLGKVLEGNVLRVAPLTEIQNMAEASLKAQQGKQQLEPFETELIPVSFAEAGKLKTLLMEGEQGKGTRLLSQSGMVSIDDRTNTLIVKDTAANIGRVKEMVAKLDRPIPQVLINARIVGINRNSSASLGINWGFNFKNGVDANGAVSDSAANAYAVQQNSGGLQTSPRPLMTTSAPVNVSLMPDSSVGRMGVHLGSISPLLDLDIELGALESEDKARTISSPRVLATNNKAATINQGVKVPYQTQSASGGTTTQFADATLSLAVTPHVAPNGFITMEVSVTNNSMGSNPTGGPPPINTKSINTQVMVKDGETIVLGGIFQNTASDGSGGVPGLSDVPFVKWLFKNKTTSDSQNELLVFITPRIVQPQ